MIGIVSLVMVMSVSSDYPLADLLIEPSALAQSPKAFLILDARGNDAFSAGHIPEAVSVNAVEWGKEFQDGKDVTGWSARLGALGITPASRIIVYDDAASKDAARIWWILKYWGVKDVRLLNGQWFGWTSNSLPIAKEPSCPSPAVFHADVAKGRLATKADVMRELREKSSQILDARSAAEHDGQTKLARRAGCIPGSTNLDWVELVDLKTQRFKTAAELKTLFSQHGLKLDQQITAHCQSGGRSSVMHFALELMGAKAVKNYHASWSEWGDATDTPVSGPSP